MARDMLTPTSDDSLTTRVIDVLRRRWLLAITTGATVLAAALSFALYLPDLYRGTSLVLVERTVSETIMRAPVSGELESRLHVIKQEILSRDRLTELINRFNLYPELRTRVSFEDVLTQTRNDIHVQPSGPEQISGRTKTVSFTLSYTGNSRDSVADVANAIASFYVQQNDRMRSDEAIRTTEFLKAQLNDAKKALERHEQAVREYTTRNIGALPQQVGVNLATLERLNTQLRLNGEQQIRIIEQREKLFDGMRDPDLLARATVADGGDVSSETLELLKQIDKLRIDLAQMETKVTPRHPDVLRLREQLAALEREADASQKRAEAAAAAAQAASAARPALTPEEAARPQLRRRTLESLDTELAKLRQEEGAIRTTIVSFEQRLESAPERQQEYSLITRDYNATKDLYDSLLKRYEEAQLTQSLETDRAGERFRVLEPALAPAGPAAPNRVRLILMGLLMALAAAVGVVLLREQFDASFHTVDEVREYTTIPVLVSIPPIGPAPIGRRVRVAFTALSAVAAIALIATLTAYFAHGNEQLVRIIERAG